MTILVTGGAGYIGSHCVLSLLERKETVAILDDLSTGFRDSVPEGAKLILGDAGDKRLVESVIGNEGVKSIFHLAASTVVPESVQKPLFYYKNNTANSRTLIEAAAEGGVSELIFSSTAAVYGQTGQEPVEETHPLAPVSPYGMSKLMTERMLIDEGSAGGPRYVILRYFNVAGADPSGRAGQSTARAAYLIKVACEAVFSRARVVRVFGTDYPTRDGTGIRDYVHVSDLAAAHIAALDYLRGGGEPDIFNCGYAHGSSVLEVIRAVEEVAGVKLNVRFENRRAGDMPSLVASNGKILEKLSWRPQFDDLKTIVSHALAWELRQVLACAA
jgi:UDP-glucose 4-epimerase